MTRILLVRHGRTTANASGILAGRSDVELDADGLLQAGTSDIGLQGTTHRGSQQPDVADPADRRGHPSR